MTAYCWKPIARNPRNRRVHPALWQHGDVYQLVRKGILIDRPLHHYASYARSRYSMLLQFGNPGVICDVRDDLLVRSAKQEKAQTVLWKTGIAPGVLLQARVDHAVPLGTQEAFYRCLKRFMEHYFASRGF